MGKITVEDLLSKKISNEIDIQTLKELLKSAKVPKEERKEYIGQMVKRQDIEMERYVLGGSEVIHGID